MSVDLPVCDVQYPAQGQCAGIWQPLQRHALTLLRFGAVHLEKRNQTERNGSGPFWRIEYYDMPVRYRCGDQASWVDLDPHEMVIRPPWTFSQRQRLHSGSHRYLALYLPDEIADPHSPPQPVLILKAAPELDTAPFAAALLQTGTLSPSERMNLLALGARCLAAYYDADPGPPLRTVHEPSPGEWPQELNSAQMLIKAELSGDLNVDRIAQAARCSASHLNRLFRKHLHCSITQYVIRQRVLRAAEHLVASEASLEQIADATGFSSRHYLSRLFARELGTSPAAFRQANRLE